MLFVDFAQEQGTLILCADGHAETAPKGEDLVCAAASILVHTAEYGLRQMHKEGKMDGEICVNKEPGSAVLLCKPKPEFLKEARQMFGTILYGFYALHESYPNAVTVGSIEDDTEEET